MTPVTAVDTACEHG